MSSSSSQAKKRGKKDRKLEDVDSLQSPPSNTYDICRSPPLSSSIDKITSNRPSPDLLAKTMASCGITVSQTSFTPCSSSTPQTSAKRKPTSVKNLSSAFDESEKLQEKTESANTKEDIGFPTGLTVNQNENPLSKSCDLSNQSEGDLCSLKTPESNAALDMDQKSPLPSDSYSPKKCSQNSQDLTGPQTIHVINPGAGDNDMPVGANKESGDQLDSQKTGALLKPSVIQFTVIEKLFPKEKNLEKESNVRESADHSLLQTEHSNADSSEKSIAKVEPKGDGSASQPCNSITLQDSNESMKEETCDGNPNELLPKISSNISQMEQKGSESENRMQETVSSKKNSVPMKASHLSDSSAPHFDFSGVPLELFKSSQSSPIKLTLVASADAQRTPTKLKPIAPKTSPCPKSVPYVPLPRISPKRKELNRQVRNILPKSFVFETKNPSPTKTTALNLKKKATLLCQKSPVKILPRPATTSSNEGQRETNIGNQLTVLRRSQRGKVKTKKKEEQFHKAVKRVKKTEEDSESAKETESEASEVEESGLSQEEDEDRMKLDDLMAASTTISFGSKQRAAVFDEDVKTKAAKKKAMSLSLLQPDLVQSDPKKDDRDTAFAQQYFNQVKETLSSEPDRFYKFLSLLKDLNKDHTNPVELYLDMVSLLSDHHQLVEDFAGFLLSFQAVECHCFSTNFQYAQIRQFLRQVELACGSSTNMYHKVLKGLSTWSSMCQGGKLEGSLREKMLSILKNVPGVLDNLISYFMDGVVTDCHSMDFEDVCLDDGTEEANDEFECITLPNEREDYNTKTCSCHCHSNSQDEKFHRRMKHCISCSLQIYEGEPVLKLSRNEFRPVSVIYPSEELEEKEKLAKAKKEAAQIALAKAKIQQQQKGKKRKKELKDSKSKKIHKNSVKSENQENVDTEDVIVESGLERSKVEKTKGTKKQRKNMGNAKSAKGARTTNKKSKMSTKNEKMVTRSKNSNKEEQMSKCDKTNKSTSRTEKSQPKSTDVDVGDQALKSAKNRSSRNEKQITQVPSSEVKEREKNCETPESISSVSNQGSESLPTDPIEETGVENSLDNESQSELFDRFILEMISDDRLSDVAVKTIQSKFPSADVDEIQSRSQQLLSLLEGMSDASTDMEDGTKIS